MRCIRVAHSENIHETRAKGILDLVHSDMCGPMSTIFLSGYLYYFLKNKDEVFSKFEEFKSLVENQTG